MDLAAKVTLIGAGLFFLNGLLTGVVKYRQIMASERASAHPYIDICHRASLLYAFASILLLTFLDISALPPTVELVAVSAMLLYFGVSILIYLVHGLLGDTDNQLRRPFMLGRHRISESSMSLFMWTLIIGEIGGFLVLFYGVLRAIL